MTTTKTKLNPLQNQTLGDAHFATPEEVRGAGLIADKGIRLGYYKAPEDRSPDWGDIIRYGGDAHLITVAPTRSGKGRDVLIPALLEYTGSCIVIDPKGQLAAVTKAHRERPVDEGGLGQEVIVLNPFNLLSQELGPTAQYNPMMALDPDADSFGSDCDSLAEAIVIRDGRGESHWPDSARQLVSGIIMHLVAKEPPELQNLAAVQRLVSGPTDKLQGFVVDAMDADYDGFVTARLARFQNINDESREALGIISTAITQTGFIGNKAIARSLIGSDFRFRDLKDEGKTVYLVLPAKQLETCGKWFRLVVASALADLWSETRGAVPVLAMLDEFAQLGHLQAIENAMGLAAGFGLQLWPILQNLTQLKKHYGDNWETFLGGAGIQQFFGPRDDFTADYISKLCGVKTVVTQGQSVQHAEKIFQEDRTGASWGQQSQPLLHPHEVRSLGPNESLIIGPQNIVIDAFRKPYRKTKEFDGLYSPDPYHKTDPPTQKSTSGPEDTPPPSDSFAAKEATAAHETRKALAKKRALPIRLLTWRSNDNPTLNALLKAEFVLTLPLRIPLALLAAPFALHNKPPGAVLIAVTLAGLSIFGRAGWEIHSTKETLHEAAKSAAVVDTLVHGSNVKGDEYYVGMREAELDAETRAGFLQFVRENGLGPLEDMTGFKDLSGIRRLNARISGYQRTVAPRSFGGDGDGNGVKVWWDVLPGYLERWDRIHHQPYVLGFGFYPKDFLEEYYDLPTRTPYGKKLYLNAKNGCPSDLLPCTSMDPKVIDAYDARHPWYQNIFHPSKWLIFQGRDVVEPRASLAPRSAQPGGRGAPGTEGVLTGSVRRAAERETQQRETPPLFGHTMMRRLATRDRFLSMSSEAELTARSVRLSMT
jgi:type IV secretion system protein VirD4